MKVKCPYCKSKNTELTYYGKENPQWHCNDCNTPLNSWFTFNGGEIPGGKHYRPARIPYGKIALACVVLALLLLVACIPVTLTFWGQTCDFGVCTPKAFYTTRPLLEWIIGGGW